MIDAMTIVVFARPIKADADSESVTRQEIDRRFIEQHRVGLHREVDRTRHGCGQNLRVFFEALNARFRDHTVALFKKHGMEIVGFWIPTDKEKGAENTLIYLLAHKSRDEAKKSWAAFVNDPDWKKARADSEVNGKLTDKVESVFLAATDYSQLK